MKRTKLVSVTGAKSIQDRIAETLAQYNITQEALLDIKISDPVEGRTTALIIYDADKRPKQSGDK